MYDSRYWLWLSLIFETGSPICDSLLFAFSHNPKTVYEADKAALLPFCKGNEALLARLLDKRLDRVYAILDFCQRENIGIVTPESRNFPSSLLKIAAQPLVLYYKGRLPELSRSLSVSVVGTRSATPYGLSAAYTISHDLASMGATVVSGMALGADTAAHRGALDAGGHTVAFLGCGIDIIYPKDNARLMQEIIAKGTVMTEYAPGLPPEGRHFPVRNRLISGISCAVLVVEAAEKSGALITASHGLKQGKLIYAVPGRVGELSGTGTNLLIRNGAKMVTSAKDIISDFSGLYEFRYTEQRPSHGYAASKEAVYRQNGLKKDDTVFNGGDGGHADSAEDLAGKASLTEAIRNISVKTVTNVSDASDKDAEREAARLVAAQPRPTVLYNGMTEEETASSYMSMETEISGKTDNFRENTERVYLTYPREPMPKNGYEIDLSSEGLERLKKINDSRFRDGFSETDRIYQVASYAPKPSSQASKSQDGSASPFKRRSGENSAHLQDNTGFASVKSGNVNARSSITPDLTGLNDTEAAVLKFVSEHQPVGIDGMSELQLPVPKLLSTVTALEIKQRLKQLPGGYFEIKK